MRGLMNKKSSFTSVDRDGETLEFTVGTKSCAPGFERVAGDRSCAPCPLGKYKSVYGESCSNCPAGKYGVATAQVSITSGCQNCPAGKFVGVEGASAISFCQVCEAGYYCPSDQVNSLSKGGSDSENPLLCAAGRYGVRHSQPQVALIVAPRDTTARPVRQSVDTSRAAAMPCALVG